jgi:indole-3-glycerol phosphate synthase
MTQQYLTQIITNKQVEIEKLRENQELIITKAAALPITKNQFVNALTTGQKLHLIAEVKKASPSKGIIRKDFNPIEIAKEFHQNGASALSVLTETQFFLGNPDFIQQIKEEVSLPILRKDFIIDPLDVYQSKIIGADAILLIKAILSVSACETLINIAHSIGLDVVLEVHNREEVEAIKSLKPDIVGINNRDLTTFHVDTNQASHLRPIIQEFHSGIIIAESGYSTLEEIKTLSEEGFNAVLIGEGLAKHPNLLSYWHHEN